MEVELGVRDDTNGFSSRVRLKLKRKQGTVTIFVDFKKAFDSLSWSTMFRILKRQGMPDFYIKLLESMYFMVILIHYL